MVDVQGFAHYPRLQRMIANTESMREQVRENNSLSLCVCGVALMCTVRCAVVCYHARPCRAVRSHSPAQAVRAVRYENTLPCGASEGAALATTCTHRIVTRLNDPLQANLVDETAKQEAAAAVLMPPPPPIFSSAAGTLNGSRKRSRSVDVTAQHAPLSAAAGKRARTPCSDSMTAMEPSSAAEARVRGLSDAELQIAQIMCQVKSQSVQ